MKGFDRRRGGTSYLVRLWREPVGSGGDEPARVYVRELRSGDERYLKSVEDLAAFFDRRERRRESAAAADRAEAAVGGRQAG